MSNAKIIFLVAVAIGLTFTAIAHEWYYNAEFTLVWRGHCEAWLWWMEQSEDA